MFAVSPSGQTTSDLDVSAVKEKEKEEERMERR
jgi:hypothetical protein